MIIIISCIVYLFIGGILNGLLSDSDDKIDFAAILWPIAISLWLGDEVGKYLKHITNKK